MPSAVVDTVGKLVTSQVPMAPGRARALLEVAYTYVNVTGRLTRPTTLQGAVDHYNGAIARTIVRGLRHPEKAVLLNIFFPCELLAPFDLTPMFPEGIAVYAACTACSEVFAEAAEARNVPESFCSYHKTMLGMVETGVIPAPLLVANTTIVCDANQVSFRRVAHHHGVPHVVLDVPTRMTDEAVDYVAQQLKALVAQLEDLTHQSFDIEQLRQAMERTNAVSSKMRAFLGMRGSVTLPTTTTSEMCGLIGTHCLSSMPETEDYFDNLLELAHQAPRYRKRRNSHFGNQSANSDYKPRIMWIHTLPNWQDSLRDIFDGAAACEIVGCDLEVDNLYELDPTKPFESLAQRMICNTNNGSGLKRVEAALHAAKIANADGAIIFCHWGCKQTMGLSQLTKQLFEDAGLPTLVLDGDGCDSRNVSDGQMVTRIGAFIEQLGGKPLEVG